MSLGDSQGLVGETVGSQAGLAAEVVVAEIYLDALSKPAREILGEITQILAYQIPLKTRFRGITKREGLLLCGPTGWGETAPFWKYQPPESSRWLSAGIEAATAVTPLRPQREQVPVNVTIPVVNPQRAYEMVIESGGCATAKVKVADPGISLAADCDRLRAVRQGLADTVGEGGKIRVDANAAWDYSQATTAIEALVKAAEGLEYVEQPCPEVSDLARLKSAKIAPIAADESIRRATDPLEVLRAGAADVAVVKIPPLGGATAALKLAEQARELGVSVVVSSALDSGVGLARAVGAAACLPDLPHACGLATAQLLRADVVENPITVQNGALQLSEPRVNANRLLEQTKYSQSQHELRNRWEKRLAEMAEYLFYQPHQNIEQQENRV